MKFSIKKLFGRNNTTKQEIVKENDTEIQTEIIETKQTENIKTKQEKIFERNKAKFLDCNKEANNSFVAFQNMMK